MLIKSSKWELFRFCSVYHEIHYIEVRYIKVWVYILLFQVNFTLNDALLYPDELYCTSRFHAVFLTSYVVSFICFCFATAVIVRTRPIVNFLIRRRNKEIRQMKDKKFVQHPSISICNSWKITYYYYLYIPFKNLIVHKIILLEVINTLLLIQKLKSMWTFVVYSNMKKAKIWT